MSESKLGDIVSRLGLEPHPEGGFYVESYRSPRSLSASSLPGYGGSRAVSTAIYFLITADSFSALHLVASDEIFHFYGGDPVEMLHLHPDGRVESPRLGMDLVAGERPQVVVPSGVWQGARLAHGGSWTLMGATVAPGFDFDDFEMGDRAELVARYPDHRKAIERFTRSSG